jgi:choline dehydrogenase-like flavoprotein
VSDARVETDVCIVGAGAAGAVIAAELATRGVDVTVLESGPRYPLAERVEAQRRFLRGLHPFPSPDPGLDRYTVDSPLPFRLEWMRMRGIGGSTLHWEGYAMRFHPSDFELRSRHGVADDWPLSYADLEPFYGRAERALGVAGDDPDPAYPRSTPFPLPAFPPSYADGIFARACRELGVGMMRIPQARNSEGYDGRAACLACGTCYACPIGARASVDLTHVPRAEATGRARFVSNSHVLRLDCESDGRVASALYRTPEGAERRVHARRFVLAGGTIENVRLCLLSASRAHPDGLANRSGLLGANFMCHPVVDVLGQVAEPLYPYRTGFSSSMSRDYVAGDGRDRAASFWLEFRNRAGGGPGTVGVQTGAWGARLRERVRGEFGHGAGMRVFLEALPARTNRITLDRSQTDSYGSPVAHLRFAIGDYERAGIAAAMAATRGIYRAMRATDVAESRVLLASHLMGAHRMGADPRTSVVDHTQRTHDHPNLWLAGPGSFVTASCANPTLTIVALAIRTADALVAA